MNQSKLIQLLKRFDRDEWKALGKFVKSSFHNSNKKLRALYDVLAKYYPEFSSKKLEREAVFYKIFPDGKAYDSRVIATLMTKMLRLAEDLLVIRQLDKDSFTRKKLLKKSYGEKNYYQAFDKATAESLQMLEKPEVKDIHYYLEAFLLHHDFYLHPDTGKFQSGVSSLEDAMKNLDAFYSLTKLKLSCEFENRNNIFSKKPELQLSEEVKYLAEKKLKKENPAFTVYLALLRLSEEEQKDIHFQKAKQVYATHLHCLNEEEQRNVLTILLNHANQRLIKGDDRYLKEQFDLYQLGLDHQLMIEQGRISDIIFSNIVGIGAALQKTEWTLKFIDAYQRFIEKDIRKLVVVFSKARLSFSENDFDTAFESLQKIRGAPLRFEIRIKSLALRCLYEMYLKEDYYYDLLCSGIEAFEKYLYRNKTLAKNRLRAYLNFCAFLKKIVLQNADPGSRSSFSLHHLKEELSKKEFIIARSWLEEKLSSE